MRLHIARTHIGIDAADRKEASGAGRYIDAREVLKRYLSGRLGADQASAFEQACREPEQLQSQLRLARDLGRTTPGEAWPADTGAALANGEHLPARRRATIALARRLAGALVAFAVGLIVMWQWPPATSPTTAPVPAAPATLAAANTVVVLDPAPVAGEARASVPTTVKLGRGAALLTLLPAIRSRDPMDWSLELSTTDAGERWRFQSIDSRRPVLTLPAAALTPGSYELRVARANAAPDEATLRVYRFRLSVD